MTREKGTLISSIGNEGYDYVVKISLFPSIPPNSCGYGNNFHPIQPSPESVKEKTSIQETRCKQGHGRCGNGYSHRIQDEQSQSPDQNAQPPRPPDSCASHPGLLLSSWTPSSPFGSIPPSTFERLHSAQKATASRLSLALTRSVICNSSFQCRSSAGVSHRRTRCPGSAYHPVPSIFLCNLNPRALSLVRVVIAVEKRVTFSHITLSRRCWKHHALVHRVWRCHTTRGPDVGAVIVDAANSLRE